MGRTSVGQRGLYKTLKGDTYEGWERWERECSRQESVGRYTSERDVRDERECWCTADWNVWVSRCGVQGRSSVEWVLSESRHRSKGEWGRRGVPNERTLQLPLKWRRLPRLRKALVCILLLARRMSRSLRTESFLCTHSGSSIPIWAYRSCVHRTWPARRWTFTCSTCQLLVAEDWKRCVYHEKYTHRHRAQV